MSDLTELGQEAIAAVSKGVADGAPLVKCQLLASAFYEALRHELRQADATKRSTLLAVTRQCHRGAAANISPVQALHELKRAVDLLQPAMPGSETVQPVARSRPVLRVIQGGTAMHTPLPRWAFSTELVWTKRSLRSAMPPIPAVSICSKQAFAEVRPTRSPRRRVLAEEAVP
jgi:hypothetical protein